jgi:putative molybdopterin biosynthesis protein
MSNRMPLSDILAPPIRVVTGLLDLGFIPFCSGRFDVHILKDRFFEKAVQLFVGPLYEQPFRDLVHDPEAYDFCLHEKMDYPQELRGVTSI